MTVERARVKDRAVPCHPEQVDLACDGVLLRWGRLLYVDIRSCLRVAFSVINAQKRTDSLPVNPEVITVAEECTAFQARSVGRLHAKVIGFLKPNTVDGKPAVRTAASALVRQALSLAYSLDHNFVKGACGGLVLDYHRGPPVFRRSANHIESPTFQYQAGNGSRDPYIDLVSHLHTSGVSALRLSIALL